MEILFAQGLIWLSINWSQKPFKSLLWTVFPWWHPIFDFQNYLCFILELCFINYIPRKCWMKFIECQKIFFRPLIPRLLKRSACIFKYLIGIFKGYARIWILGNHFLKVNLIKLFFEWKLFENVIKWIYRKKLLNCVN